MELKDDPEAEFVLFIEQDRNHAFYKSAEEALSSIRKDLEIPASEFQPRQFTLYQRVKIEVKRDVTITTQLSRNVQP